MPPADKWEVLRIIESRYPDAACDPPLERLELIVYRYFRDTYTSYKYKKSLNEEEISEVHEQLRDTIASWRGDFYFPISKEPRAGLITTQPSETTNA